MMQPGDDDDARDEQRQHKKTLAGLLQTAQGPSDSPTSGEEPTSNEERLAQGYRWQPESDQSDTYNRAMGAISDQDIQERQDRQGRSQRIRGMIDKVPEAIMDSEVARSNPGIAAGAATAVDTAKDYVVPEYDPHSPADLPMVSGTVSRIRGKGLPSAAPSKRASMMEKIPTQQATQTEWNGLSAAQRELYDNDISKFRPDHVRDSKINADQAEQAYRDRNVTRSNPQGSEDVDLGNYWEMQKPIDKEPPRTIDYRTFTKKNERR